MSADERYANNPPVQHPRIRGRCPSCRSESLFLGSDGYVTCGVIGCKDPAAPHDLLSADASPLVRTEPAEEGFDAKDAKKWYHTSLELSAKLDAAEAKIASLLRARAPQEPDQEP